MENNESNLVDIKYNTIKDLSMWLLLLSNLITIYFTIKENWDLPTLMIIYWFQSIIIGFFNFIRILHLNNFSTKGFKINGQPTKATPRTKIFTAFFFLFHYGFFHFFYLMFFLTFTKGIQLIFVQLNYIFIITLLFLINHIFSYFYNKPRDTKKQNIATLMFFPYARIVPMHFTIFLGLFDGIIALPFFLFLKTISDIIMHVVEHKIIMKNEESNNFNYSIKNI